MINKERVLARTYDATDSQLSSRDWIYFPAHDEAWFMALGHLYTARVTDDDDVRTYGHIVIDEVQDLTPMQLRMVSRRSLNGSMTVVGDIAQATGALAPNSWEDVLRHLPNQRGSRVIGLSVGYRIPGPNMDLAARVLVEAAPDLTPPRSVRQDGRPPRIVTAAPLGSPLATVVVRTTLEEAEAVGAGNVAVICPGSMVEVLSAAFAEAGVKRR